MFEDLVQAFEFAYQLQRAFRTHALDGLEVVAPEEDAEVDELRHVHLEALEGLREADFGYGRLARFGEGEVAEEDGRAEGEGVHVF